jgi:hypothetical protein
MSAMLIVATAALLAASLTGTKVGDGSLSSEWVGLLIFAGILDAARIAIWWYRSSKPRKQP